MISEFDNGSAIILITIICSLSSILWPILVDLKSRMHTLGMLMHTSIQFCLLLLIFDMIKELNIEISVQLLAVNGFSLGLKISRVGVLFALLISILWPAAYFYSIGYLSTLRDNGIPRFLIFLNLSVSSAIILSFAGDLMTMFIIYECLTLCTLPLVGHNFSVHVNSAIKKYILYLFFGSICLWLPAILYIQANTGLMEFMHTGIAGMYDIDRQYLLIIFLLSTFGIAKGAIFPMHTWLPSAMAANYPTSAILHAVLVVNSGIYCLYKMIFEIFSAELVWEILRSNSFVYYIVLFGVFYSCLMAIFQKTIKKILAWSTVSQLNLIFLIFISTGPIFNDIGIIALTHHSFCKITLFFCAGYIYSSNYATKLEEFRNCFYQFKIEYILFCITALLLVSLPILGTGEYKKLVLSGANSHENNILILAIIISSVFSFIYFGKIILEMSTIDQSILRLEHKRHKPHIYMKLSSIYCFILCIFMYNYLPTSSLYLQSFLDR